MAASDKIRILSSVPSKIYLDKKRIAKIYRADTKTQIFPFTPPLPVIDTVDPSSALIAGGSTVIITGEFFSTTSSVKFGATNASGFTINSSTTITATVPPGSIGDTTITVTNVTGVSNAYPFTYTDRAPAQRIYKTGSQNIGYFNNTPITGMIADPAYPATVVVADGIMVKAGKQILIDAAQVRGGTNAGNKMRIVDTEGTLISEVGSGALMTLSQFLYTPPIDTVISQQGYSSTGLGGNTTVPDDPGTYIMITPV
jgi:hypothetical protein